MSFSAFLALFYLNQLQITKNIYIKQEKSKKYFSGFRHWALGFSKNNGSWGEDI
jgi:hypothetical protein